MMSLQFSIQIDPYLLSLILPTLLGAGLVRKIRGRKRKLDADEQSSASSR